MLDDRYDSLSRCPDAKLGRRGGDVTSTLAQRYRARPRPPFECVALVLQGGGALGSYQALARRDGDVPL